MAIWRSWAERIYEEYGILPAIIFGSAIHGSGRSFIANKVAEEMEKEELPVLRLSTGEIVRHIAEEEGVDINELMKMQAENPEKYYQLNLSIDARIHEIVEHGVQENIVVLDSNLAAYHVEIPTAAAILVYTKPDVAAGRVFHANREGERRYRNVEEAKRALIERTREDIATYRALSKIVRDNFWKMVYRLGAEDMEKNLEAVLQERVPKSPYYNETVDNNGSPEKTLEQVRTMIKRLTDG